MVNDRNILGHRVLRASLTHPTTARRRLRVGYTRSVPTILILEDDASARNALVGMLRDLFPRTRVFATRVDASSDIADGDEAATLVLTGLAAVEEARRRLPKSAGVIALTRDMGPDTLLTAEALAVTPSVPPPPTSHRLRQLPH